MRDLSASEHAGGVRVPLGDELAAELPPFVHRMGGGQAVVAPAGEWVRYSTPGAEGAEYVAVCVPAFSYEMVHRE